MGVEDYLHDANRLTLLIGALAAATIVIAFASRRLRVPTPLAFLIIGVLIQTFAHRDFTITNGSVLVPLGTVALAIVLFEGGFHGGMARMRPVLGPVLAVGLVGTFATAGIMAVFGHVALGLSWGTASLVAIALAPTDPAAVFSVLAGQSLRGRVGEILEGESGFNDPVGIALMIGAIEVVQGDSSGVGPIIGAFASELVIGALVGIAIGFAANWVLTHVELPSPPIHAIGAVATALLALGVAAELHGSGFLAAFVAGLVVGTKDVRYQRSTEHSLSVGANLAETAMFLALGLTLSLDRFNDHIFIELAVFIMLTFIVRPIVVGVILSPTSLTRAERVFIAWGGLRGAVPILLAFFVVIDDVPDASTIYSIVFVVVTLSILVQGVTLPWLARRTGLAEESAQ